MIRNYTTHGMLYSMLMTASNPQLKQVKDLKIEYSWVLIDRIHSRLIYLFLELDTITLYRELKISLQQLLTWVLFQECFFLLKRKGWSLLLQNFTSVKLRPLQTIALEDLASLKASFKWMGSLSLMLSLLERNGGQLSLQIFTQLV